METNVIDMSKNNPWMDVEVYLWVYWELPNQWKEDWSTEKELMEKFINMKKIKAQKNLWDDLLRYINTLTYAKKCLKNI